MNGDNINNVWYENSRTLRGGEGIPEKRKTEHYKWI